MEANQLKVFLVDENISNLNKYAYHMESDRLLNVRTFTNSNSCIANLSVQPDIVFLAYGTCTKTGLQIIHQIKNFNPGINVVLLPGTEYLRSLALIDSAKGRSSYSQQTDYLMEYMDLILDRMTTGASILRKSA
jgi:DNA-binding NtrC family response regulator